MDPGSFLGILRLRWIPGRTVRGDTYGSDMSWFEAVSTDDGGGLAPSRSGARGALWTGSAGSATPASGSPASGTRAPGPAASGTRASGSAAWRATTARARGTEGSLARPTRTFAEEPTVRWHVAEPSPALASLLVELDRESLEHLDDFNVVEFVAAAERIASWAHHLAARAAAELSRRESMTPPPDVTLTCDLPAERVAAAELGLRLGASQRKARQLVQLGLSFRQSLAPTGEALAAGVIDSHKAQVIVDALREVPTQLAVGVQDAVLPRAARRTPRQLAGDIRSTLIQLDPTEAAERHREAAAGRYLSRPTPLPDGMAGLWLRTTAPEAHALYGTIDAAARSARRAGDDRTLDQLRADLLSDRVRGEARGASSLRADVRVLVPLSTLLGTSDEAGELDGYGQIDPDMARAIARGGTWRRLVTDPASGTVLDVGRTRYQPPSDLAEHVRHRDRTCVSPTCDTSAWSCELDHTEPFRPGSPDGGPTAARNLGALSRGCHQLKTHARFRLEQTSPGVFRWTTPTGHVYARDAEPPVHGLARHHPIHELRRDLAALDPPDAELPPPF